MLATLIIGLYVSMWVKNQEGESWTRCTVCTAPYIGLFVTLNYLFIDERVLVPMAAVAGLELLRIYNGDD